MKKGFFIKNYFFLACYFCYFQIICTNLAFANSARTTGVVSAKVVENKITIDGNASSSHNIQKEIENIVKNGGSSIQEKKVVSENKLAISYQISSKPNTILNVSFFSSSSKDKKDGEEDDGSVIIELKNSAGEIIRAKLKASDTITFDKNGKSDLNIAPKLDLGSGKLEGTYKATYDVIISY